ncbi:hypothetical protein K449DRAFT_388065 [Hypoxylon sp. EC38]|nr:hypothetical protein K449DRAFT_388065 [Hypoxylon sp. EC38]
MDIGSNDSDAEETLQSPAISSLSKSLGKLEPSAREPREQGFQDLQPAPSGGTTTSITAQKRHTKSKEKQKPPVKEDRTVQTRKRKASTSDAPVTDITPNSKKRKTNDDQSRKKKRRTHRERKRRRNALRRQQNQNNLTQPQAGDDSNGPAEGNVGWNSTVTSPIASRPTTAKTNKAVKRAS